MKPIQLYRSEDGKIVDGDGMEYSIPQKPIGATHTNQFHSEGLDIEGGVTITGNLTVQQSDWVYLRGPITGSGAVINGPITASSLWIRNTTGEGLGEMRDMGNLIVDTDVKLKGISLNEKREELERRIRECEKRIEELSGIIYNIDGNKK